MSGDYEIGKGKPPVYSQFKKNQSGNPKGRPKKATDEERGYQVLDKIVTVVENGVSRQMRADRAFLMMLINKGISSSGRIGRLALRMTALAEQHHPRVSAGRTFIFCVYAERGDIEEALCLLGVAERQDSYRPTARVMLEPWVVSMYLAKLGDKALSLADQKTILSVTRKPHLVKYPNWWMIGA